MGKANTIEFGCFHHLGIFVGACSGASKSIHIIVIIVAVFAIYLEFFNYVFLTGG